MLCHLFESQQDCQELRMTQKAWLHCKHIFWGVARSHLCLWRWDSDSNPKEFFTYERPQNFTALYWLFQTSTAMLPSTAVYCPELDFTKYFLILWLEANWQYLAQTVGVGGICFVVGKKWENFVAHFTLHHANVPLKKRHSEFAIPSLDCSTCLNFSLSSFVLILHSFRIPSGLMRYW